MGSWRVRRSSRYLYEREVLVVLEADIVQVNGRLSQTHQLLREYLAQDRRFVFVLTGMQTTCGEGFSTEAGNKTGAKTNGSEACLPCIKGFFKSKLDNSSCVACPSYSITESLGASSAGMCECVEGWDALPLNMSRPDSVADQATRMDEVQCVKQLQHVSVGEAAAAARSVSTAVSVILAANVAVAVAGAIATSVSTAVAAASGGAAGGALGASGGSAAMGGFTGGSTGSLTASSSGSSGSGGICYLCVYILAYIQECIHPVCLNVYMYILIEPAPTSEIWIPQ